MIKNKFCPYCKQPLKKSENKDNSRSVEHLIPNTALTNKRKKGEGDFYACRKCNTRKSNIDYVLGVIAKAQSSNSEVAANALISAVTKEDGRSKRFIDMVLTAKELDSEVHMEIPIKGEELIEYLHFLGKGQFFKVTGAIYDPKKYVMVVKFVNKQVLSSLEASYRQRHGSSPFSDLTQNSRSEVINDGECIIWSKNRSFLFIFHNYAAVIVNVLRKNRKNLAKVGGSESYLINSFSYQR